MGYQRCVLLGVLFFLMGIGKVAQANVVGTGPQNFNSITSGLDFVTVQSSETLKPGVINFGLFWNLAGNSLPTLTNGAAPDTEFSDRLLGADLNFGMGLMKGWDFGVSFPFIVSQSVSATTGSVGQFTTKGNTEVRVNTKYRFLGDEHQGLAFVFSTNFGRIRNDPYEGIDAGPIFNFELAGDLTLGSWALGANVGFRRRSPGTKVASSPFDPFGNQWIASLAGSYLIPNWDLKLISEIYMSFPSGSVDEDLNRSLSSAEWLLGGKYDFTSRFAGHLGFGTEISQGVSSPDWRIYLGLNYAIGPLWGGEDKKVPVIPPKEEKKTIVWEDVRFNTNSADLTDQSLQVVKKFAEVLKKVDFKTIKITGHTDSVGKKEYNQSLSERRANTIRDELIRSGFAEDKLIAGGKGEEEPIADNGNYQGRQRNRRVEFDIEY